LADLHELPFDENSFDVITVSFGIRNVAEPKKVLREMTRVLKPSGRIIILEFGQPQGVGLKQAYQFYSRVLVPRLGGFLSRNRQAYEYLHLSSIHFPCGKKFFDILCDLTQFESASFESLYAGIAYLYLLQKKS
jgi:demethylmenaquinone methyltransferase/2-methoxy-6-polyprenyl-1,4-benzoquinol methylase